MRCEWKTVKLGDHCLKIGSGATPRGGNNVYLDRGEYTLVRSQNIHNTRFDKMGLVYISENHANQLSSVTLQKNDILLNITGDSVARCCEIDSSVLPARVNQHVAIIRTNENELCSRFLLYFLVTPAQQSRMLTLASAGATRNALTKGMIESFDIPLPPLHEQKRIAEILGVLDDKIANNAKINHHLEQIAQAIFKNWFVDYEPWGGVMPDDWRIAELGDVAWLGAGGDKPAVCTSIATAECSIPVYSNGIDNFGLYGYTDSYKVSEECVTVSARGTIGYVCLRQEPFVPIVRLVTVIPHSTFLTAKYLYLYLRNIHIAGVGTTQQQLTVPDFKKYAVLVPSLEVVSKFTSMVTPMFDEIRHNRVENALLAEIRDALLPRLMSGEIDFDTARKISHTE